MHHLLEQQTKRFLRKDAPLPQGWDMFLAAVDDAYSTTDVDRQRFEHSLGMISKELAGLRADLAERQLAEAQLEHLLSLLGAILESTTDGMLALNRDGMIVRFNQRFVEMWNIPDEIMAFWEHQKVVEHVLNQLKDPGSLREKIAYLQLHPEMESNDILECMDGRIIERYSLPQPIGVDSLGRILSFRDITARKRAEEALHREKEEQKALIRKLETAHNKLLQSEKMASIGQLAAGVAHEINNPIGYVNSNLGSLGQYVEKLIGVMEACERAESSPYVPSLLEEIRSLKQETDWGYLKQDVRDLLRESAEGIVRVKQIVQDLKDFSHVDQAEWLFVDLHKGIDSTLNIVRSEIKYNAEVVKEYGIIPPVECMASQLNQVFMNMLINASHAIGEGSYGKITIRSGTKNDMAWVEFSDTGKGIAPENMKRIFDPFFTTKPVGKGTGLGLSLSFGIIEKHRGHIEVESEAGKGATFRVWLPVKQSSEGASNAAVGRVSGFIA
ncbi:MAG: ATP-binding protein [Gallionella sp.]|nr:ATP-binding protein [Gallionella sp.]